MSLLRWPIWAHCCLVSPSSVHDAAWQSNTNPQPLKIGYDTGVMSSVLALHSFKVDFGLPTDSTGFASQKNAHISQNVVSLLTAGCFFGAIFAAILNNKYGRKNSLIGFTLIFLLGAIIQVTSLHHIGQMYGGRFVAGLGIGGMSSITPIFVAENCPPAVRGRITGLFQEFLVIGSTFAYWLNYGVSLHIAPSTKQWRIPVRFRCISISDLSCIAFKHLDTEIK